jgi:hypothetical protein
VERIVDHAGLGVGAKGLVDDGLEAGGNGDRGGGGGYQRDQRGGELAGILERLAPDHPQRARRRAGGEPTGVCPGAPSAGLEPVTGAGVGMSGAGRSWETSSMART